MTRTTANQNVSLQTPNARNSHTKTMSKPRRRKYRCLHDNVAATTSPPIQVSQDGDTCNNMKSGTTLRRKKRKKKRSKTTFSSPRFAAIVLAAVIGIVSLYVLVVRSSKTTSSKNYLRTRLYSWSPGRNTNNKAFANHVPLYDAMHRHARGIALQTNDEGIIRTQHESASAATHGGRFNLSSMYGNDIAERGCNLTAIFMDPRLATLGLGQPAWYTLESVAAFAPDACVLLQTASCDMEAKMTSTTESLTENIIHSTMSERIYNHSLPLFRRMIDQGRVRITFLNHTKYNLRGCSDFGNPSSAWMNVNYWRDEFLDADSDLVLIVQDDSVLCRPLDVSEWNDYAYVGGLWPRVSTKLTPKPPEGMCLGMPQRWKTWLMPQRQWERQQRQQDRLPNENRHLYIRPETLLNKTFPETCGGGVAPVGNGGFSFRNRTWLIEAVTTCPHAKLSGLDTDGTPLACKVLDSINEDYYFGVVLRGIGAPLPNAWHASRFSVEMIFPEEALQLYGEPPLHYTTESRRSDVTINVDGRHVTVPVGFHKPWWYHPNDLLQSHQVQKACPFLQYIFSPEQSKWKEFAQEAPWIGIGT